MRYPDFLKEHQTIGIIAPSFGCASGSYRTCFDNAVKQLQKRGYFIEKGPNCHMEVGFGKSNTPKACADEINDFFLHKKSDVIISCGGGETMNEDLPFVDFEAIQKARPIWYMGFSDNTNLTFLLPTLCDTAAIYGPNISSFGMEPWHSSLDDAISLLSGKNLSFSNYEGWEKEKLRDDEHPLLPYNITQPYKHVLAENCKDGENFSGRLLGGCLDVLMLLAGTRFDKVKEFNERYREDGVIWFLEACDLNVMSVRRALWRLGEAGWFDTAKGFIIGRSRLHDDMFGDFNMHDAYISSLEGYHVPIVLDVDLGHLPPMIPLISGSYASICVKQDKFSVEMRLL